MEKLEIEKAIELYNHRTKRENAIKYLHESTGLLSRKQIGMMLYPNVSEGTASTNMTRLVSGSFKRVPIDRIKKLCTILGVDENFLFGSPSIYDKEYEQYTSNDTPGTQN